MELEHSFTIPVPPEQAWQVLLDVKQVAPCMPGASIDSADGDEIKGRIKVKVGPVTMTYAGTARFVERDEQARFVTLEGSGKETRGGGTASATIRSSLQDEGGQTRVIVRTTLNVTGRPAQFGRGVMAEVGGRLIERFAANLAQQLAGGADASGNGTVGGPGPADASSGGGPGSADAGADGQAAGTQGTGDGPAGAGQVSIEEIGLPVRTFNSLRRQGIHSLGDLSARTEPELLAIENLGPQSLSQIKQRLAERGLTLAAAPAGDAATASDAPGAARADATVDSAPRLAARPPDEDALDLLSVAGFPVLKRALPALGALAAVLLLVLGLRRRRNPGR